MTISNYPSGFNEGVLIRDLYKPETTTGKNFYVGNHSVLVLGELGASDANPGTFLKPFATIDKAINSCSAGRGDRIYVRPGHAETVDAVTDIVPDVSTVSIIGMGVGEARPTITFATATAAAIPVTGANNVFANMVFKCNIASQNHMFDVAADDCKIIGCDFREGSATGLSFITADTADGDSDRLEIIGCKFHAPTAGNMDNAIQLAKDFTGVRIKECEIYGDFDVAPIDIPAGGNAQVDCQIGNCKITNLQSGQHGISINGTSSTGKIYDTYVQTDAIGTSVDAGGLEMYNVLYHNGTDQTVAVPVAPTTSDYNSLLGTKVTKSAATLPASTTQDIFTISGGRVLVRLLTGEVTTVIQSQACNLSVVHATTVGGDVTVASTVDINGDEAGTLYGVEGDGTALVATSSGGFLQGIGGGGFVLAEGTMNITTSATNTGATAWELWYIPLDDGATVVSA